MKYIITLMSGLLLSGCTTVGFWLANMSVSKDAMHTQYNVSYGAHPQQTLDIYTPKDNSNGHVIVYLYGGGWSDGSKNNYAFIADRFASAGYSVVIPDYRKYPDVTYPTFVKDSAAAIAWVHKNISPKTLYVMGHSAGAYNAAMMGADGSYLAAHNLLPSDIDGIIGLAGPYNFTPKKQKYKRIFANLDNYNTMHVSHYVSGDEPPMLLLHGADDNTVSTKNSTDLHHSLRNAGVDSQVNLYPSIGHLRIVGALSEIWVDDYSVYHDILAFMERHTS